MDDKLKIIALIKKSQRLLGEGKTLHAIQQLEKLREEFPNDNDVIFELANLYFNISKPDAAVSILKERLEAEMENRELRFYIGFLLFKNKCWDECVETLSFLQPEEEPVIFFFSGYANYMLNEFELAKINLEKFIAAETAPEFLEDAFMYLARIYLGEKKYNNALGLIKSAEALNKDHYNIHLLYSIAYCKLDMIEHAERSIKKTLMLNKKDPLVIEWAGRIFFKSGSHQKAIKYFDALLKNGNEINSEIFSQLGISYLNLKQLKEAEFYLRQAVTLDPQDFTSKKALKELIGNKKLV